MPHLRSIDGLKLIRKYTNNWLVAVLVYAGLKAKATIKFKDGTTMELNKANIWTEFSGAIYRRYLTENGFKYKNDDTVITPNGLQLTMRYTYSGFVVDEIFIMREYGAPDLHGRTVIDVGASVGDSTLYFIQQGAQLVYGFEPDNVRYEIALKNISANSLQNRVIIYNRPAIADDINRLVKDKNLHDIFMKIDCEGCEYELVKGLDLSNISDLVMEFHKSGKQLVNILNNVHFLTDVKGQIIHGKRTQ